MLPSALKLKLSGWRKFLLWGLVILYFFYGLFGLMHHEMWRDELQAWMLARDSSSLSELIYNLRYEGHPPLWHLLLYAITRVTDNPVFMQALHLLIGTLTIGVFVAYAPFAIWQKLLFILGYFPAYEFMVKSRNYSLSILFLFIFCALFKQRDKQYVWLFVSLFLAAQANFVAATLSLALGCLLMASVLLERKPAFIPRTDTAFSSLLFACTAGLLFFQIRLPPDSVFPVKPGFFTTMNLQGIIQTLNHIHSSYSPLYPGKDWVMHFRFSLAEILFFSLVFLRRPMALFAYILGSGALLSFYYVTNGNISLRHIGFLFILLIVCLWLAADMPAKKLPLRWLDSLAGWAERLSVVVISGFLIVHVMAGFLFQKKDWQEPYSAAQEISAYIKSSQFNNLPIMGDVDYAVSPIAGFMNNKIYYLSSGTWGSFVVWNKQRTERVITPALVLSEARKLRAQTGKNVLVIFTYRPDPAKLPGLHLVKEFTRAWYEPMERYCLYYFDG